MPLSLPEAAAQLQCSRQFLNLLVSRGDVEHSVVDGLVVFTTGQLDALGQRLTDERHELAQRFRAFADGTAHQNCLDEILGEHRRPS